MKFVILILISFICTFASDAQECNEIIYRADQDTIVVSNQEKIKLKSCLLNFLMNELGSELNYENGVDYESEPEQEHELEPEQEFESTEE